jgi:hypothetical protein
MKNQEVAAISDLSQEMQGMGKWWETSTGMSGFLAFWWPGVALLEWYVFFGNMYPNMFHDKEQNMEYGAPEGRFWGEIPVKSGPLPYDKRETL